MRSIWTIATNLALVVSALGWQPAIAGDAGMQQWFNDMGMYANSTPSGAFKGQTMNTYTGGGLYARAPQKSYQFATFDPPRIGAGCGGIDLYTGAFSFINSDQIVNLLKNASTNTTGYLFSTALESICPSCSSAMKFLQDQSAKMNGLNMNSCELAKGTVNATLTTIGLRDGRNEAGLYGKMAGIGDDVTAAWQGIKEDASKIGTATAAKRADPTVPEGSKNRNVNLVWAALSDITRDGAPLSQEEKELAMSMVGTVIVTDIPPGQVTSPAGSGQNIYFQPPTVVFDRFVDGDNGQLNINKYTCTTAATKWDCADISSGGLATTPWPTGSLNFSFRDMVERSITNLMAGIDARQTSTTGNSDFTLINSSSLSVWKMISTYSQLPGGASLTQEYIDMIATDIAYQYYAEGIRAVHAALARENGKTGNPMAAMAIEMLLKEAKDKQSAAIAIVQKRYSAGIAVNSLNQQVTALEKTLRSQVNAYTSQTRK
jgi:conjugative transfer pilus assembly protein TraH